MDQTRGAHACFRVLSRGVAGPVMVRPLTAMVLALTVCALTCSAAVGAGTEECLAWTLRSDDGPSARHHHATAYDSVRGVTVLFGGISSEVPGYLGDTWEWDGTNWTLRSSEGPPPRYQHAMAFDSKRGVTVLFGGYDGGYRADTWEWDGSYWMLRANTGPAARRNHAMAYDDSRGMTVLFGGFGVISIGGGKSSAPDQGNYMYDTWEWSGLGWTPRATTGPAARAQHDMAYDSRRGVTVLYGGEDGQKKSDTWEWDGSAWVRRLVQGPTARFGHSMAYDGDKGFTMLFGGDDGNYTEDTWGWDGEKWWGWAATGPSARVHLSFVYDSIRDRLVLFGGHDGMSSSRNTWELEWLGDPPVIQQQPEDMIICLGAEAVFTVAAKGTAPLAYQWLKDDGEIPGANDASLVIPEVGDADVGEYRVEINNLCGAATSKTATLAVSAGHYIILHPEDRTELEGDDVTFWVVAHGSPLLTYQWRKDGEGIPLMTANSLTIVPLRLEDAGVYDVVVTDVCGSITSRTATLTVIPNCNGNDIPDECDLSCGRPGGPCDIPGCGSSADCNANTMPDECEPDDEDGDGVIDDCDRCPGTPPGLLMGRDGCPVPYGACCFVEDMCAEGISGTDCGLALGDYLGDGLTCDGDPDEDGAVGCHDGCPVDPEKPGPGFCGCGVPDAGDADGDGALDCIDACPDTPPGTLANVCGCAAYGACRFRSGGCWESVQWSECVAGGGVYQGDGVTCAEERWYGDFDGDSDSDLRDMFIFQRCFGEPPPLSAECDGGDIDGCGTIDLLDCRAFHEAFTGP